MTRFLAVTDSEAFVDRVAACLAADEHATVTAVSAATTELHPEALLPPPGEDPIDVVLIGPGIEQQTALRFAAALDEVFPHLALVLVARADQDLVFASMRAGVRDVLDPDGDEPTFAEALSRSSRAAASRRRDGQLTGNRPDPRVIVVLSPKGGVGKTTLATNTAVALGRHAPLGTVLVDLDTQFGDVASALGILPAHTLRDAVGTAAASDAMVLKAYLEVHEAGFYSLCAPDDPADADRISSESVSHLLYQLSTEFPFVVIDTAAGLGDHTLAALEFATDALFVVSMDVQSARALRKEVAVLGELGLLPQRRHLVVNLADRKSGLTVRDIEATVGLPASAVLRRSPEVALSMNAGQPLLLSRKRGRATSVLERLAALVSSPRTPEGRRSHRRARIE